MSQVPVIKHNVARFLAGKEVNAVYDGYTYMPLWLGLQYMTNFQHTYGYEPHWKNNFVPRYGIFSRTYFSWYIRRAVALTEKYAGFKSNYGPPTWSYSPRFPELENNPYLAEKGIPLDSLRMHRPQQQISADEKLQIEEEQRKALAA